MGMGGGKGDDVCTVLILNCVFGSMSGYGINLNAG